MVVVLLVVLLMVLLVVMKAVGRLPGEGLQGRGGG
jgi:hypothetical protein